MPHSNQDNRWTDNQFNKILLDNINGEAAYPQSFVGFKDEKIIKDTWSRYAPIEKRLVKLLEEGFDAWLTFVQSWFPKKPGRSLLQLLTYRRTINQKWVISNYTTADFPSFFFHLNKTCSKKNILKEEVIKLDKLKHRFPLDIIAFESACYMLLYAHHHIPEHEPDAYYNTLLTASRFYGIFDYSNIAYRKYINGDYFEHLTIDEWEKTTKKKDKEIIKKREANEKRQRQKAAKAGGKGIIIINGVSSKQIRDNLLKDLVYMSANGDVYPTKNDLINDLKIRAISFIKGARPGTNYLNDSGDDNKLSELIKSGIEDKRLNGGVQRIKLAKSLIKPKPKP